MINRVRGRSAFTLIELLVVIAIVALLVSILLPALSGARKNARTALCQGRLQQYGVATNNYATDYQNKIWSFSWQRPAPGRPRFQTQYGDLFSPTTDLQAAHYQAVDIIRRRGLGNTQNFPTQGAWIPHVLYSHLVLLDYLQARLPEPLVRCPDDSFRGRWAESLVNGSWQQTQAQFNLPNSRWPYSSSYQVSPYSYALDRNPTGAAGLQNAGSDGFYTVPTNAQYPLGTRKINEVAFPSMKMQVMEDQSRHWGKVNVFYTHNLARIQTLQFDGSIRNVQGPDMNPGYYPVGNPANYTVANITFTYDAVLGDPPWPGGGSTLRNAKIRWTAGGLKGVDVGGKIPINPARLSGTVLN
jgi:prepilin-type N-terminal cleavage/methylation domain-containing protein